MDNRLPLAIEALKEALVALGDVGVKFKLDNNPDDIEAMKYLLLRATSTLDRSEYYEKLCERAFYKVQQALKQFSEEELKLKE
jgi:hypothetical protein